MLPRTQFTKTRGLVCILTLVILLLSLSLACAPTNILGGPDQVLFRSNWSFDEDEVPFFVGLEKGFFLDEGIALSIGQGVGSANTVKLLGAGTILIGSADYGLAMKGINNEAIPIKGVFGFQQLSAEAIISRPDAPVNSPKDLAGKSVAVAQATGEAETLPLLLKKNGVDINSVKIVYTQPKGGLPLLLEKKVDALAGFFTSDGEILSAEFGAQAPYFTYMEAGVGHLGKGILANTRTIQEQPDLLERFFRAFQVSLKYAIENPAEAIDIYMEYNARDDKEILSKSWPLMIKLLHTPNTLDKPLGWVSEEDVKLTEDLFIEQGAIQKRISPDTYYTNEFIDDIFSP